MEPRRAGHRRPTEVALGIIAIEGRAEATFSEHPMAVLPCCHLPQRNVIDAAYEVWPAKGASGNQSLQPDEGRMMHEILVDAEYCTVLFSGRQ